MEPRLNRKLYTARPQQIRNKSTVYSKSTSRHVDIRINKSTPTTNLTAVQQVRNQSNKWNAARRLRRSNFYNAQGELTSQ